MQYLSLPLYMRYSVKYEMMSKFANLPLSGVSWRTWWGKLANVIMDHVYKAYSIQYLIDYMYMS